MTWGKKLAHETIKSKFLGMFEGNPIFFINNYIITIYLGTWFPSINKINTKPIFFPNYNFENKNTINEIRYGSREIKNLFFFPDYVFEKKNLFHDIYIYPYVISCEWVSLFYRSNLRVLF